MIHPTNDISYQYVCKYKERFGVFMLVPFCFGYLRTYWGVQAGRAGSGTYLKALQVPYIWTSGIGCLFCSADDAVVRE